MNKHFPIIKITKSSNVNAVRDYEDVNSSKYLLGLNSQPYSECFYK